MSREILILTLMAVNFLVCPKLPSFNILKFYWGSWCLLLGLFSVCIVFTQNAIDSAERPPAWMWPDTRPRCLLGRCQLLRVGNLKLLLGFTSLNIWLHTQHATSYDFRIPQILKLSEINKNDGSVLRSTARLDCNIAITNVVWKALSPRWWVDQQQVKQQHILISKPSQLPALFNRPEFGPRTKIFVLFMQETLTQKFIKEEKPVQWLHQTIQIYLTKWYNFINIYKIVYYQRTT